LIRSTPFEVPGALSEVCDKVLIPGLEASLRGEAGPHQLKLNLSTALMLGHFLRHLSRRSSTGNPLPASSQKAEPFRLQLSSYPFAIELQTRLSDLDVQGHLDNSALLRLYEEGRSRFCMARLGDPPLPADDRRTWKALVANVNISHLGAAHYPAPVTIGTGIGSIGNRSYVVSHALFQAEHCLGVCDCTLVLVAQITRKSMAIPDALRKRLQPLLLNEEGP
jgi:acyl-CoA thioester hydrolase